MALLAGLPHTVPGMAVDRMCAGALTATTVAAGEIALGAADLVLAGGVEHMGHHPMGEDVDFNPRFVAERLIDESAAVMGKTAENLHDELPAAHPRGCGQLRVAIAGARAAAWDDPDGVYAHTVVPMSVFRDEGWKVADRDEFLRPDTTMAGLAGLRTPFRAGGRVTAGNSAGLTDGATACLLAAEGTARELGLEAQMRLVGFAYAGVEPHLMGLGPVPATRQVLERTGLGLDDIGLFELNEPFAVQVLTWCEELGVDPDDARLNPYGGAIACGHPLAATGVRLMASSRSASGGDPTPATASPRSASASAWVPRCSGKTCGMGDADAVTPVPPAAGRHAGRPGGAADDRQRRRLAEAEHVRTGGAGVARRRLDRARDGDWRGLVLTGKPLVFAAGADITQFPGSPPSSPGWAARPATSCSRGSARFPSRRSPR